MLVGEQKRKSPEPAQASSGEKSAPGSPEGVGAEEETVDSGGTGVRSQLVERMLMRVIAAQHAELLALMAEWRRRR